MMADTHTLQATQTGEADVYRPAKPESTPSIVFNDAELELVTPELGHQVQIQTELLKNWLLLRAKNHIRDSLFAREPVFADDSTLVDQVYKPELVRQKNERFGAAMEVVKQQLPYVEERLAKAKRNYDNVVEESQRLKITQTSETPSAYSLAYAETVKDRVKNRRDDVLLLSQVVQNTKMVGHTHERMIVHIQGLERDIDSDALRIEFNELTAQARILAYQEAVLILDDKIKAEADPVRKDSFVRQQETLKKELALLIQEEQKPSAIVDALPGAKVEEVEAPDTQFEKRSSLFMEMGARGIRLLRSLAAK